MASPGRHFPDEDDEIGEALRTAAARGTTLAGRALGAAGGALSRGADAVGRGAESLGYKLEPGLAPREEPVGDWARRQGTMVEEPPADDEPGGTWNQGAADRFVERGAHKELAESLSAMDGKVIGPGASKEDGNFGLPPAFARNPASGPGLPEAFAPSLATGAGPVRIPGSPGYGEAAPAAEPPPAKEPLSIRYKDKEGNWKTHTLGQAAPTDIARSGTAYDPITRTTQNVTPVEGAGVSTASMESLPMAQRPASYFESDELGTHVAENAAKRKLAETLAGDPFSREKAVATTNVAQQTEIEGVKSGLRRAEERQRERTYLEALRPHEEERARAKAEIRKTVTDPKMLRQADQEIDDKFHERVSQIERASGYGARISGNVGGAAASQY